MRKKHTWYGNMLWGCVMLLCLRMSTEFSVYVGQGDTFRVIDTATNMISSIPTTGITGYYAKTLVMSPDQTFLLFTSQGACSVLKLQLASSTVSVFAGGTTLDASVCGYKDAIGTQARFQYLANLRMIADGSYAIVIEDTPFKIRKVWMDGTVQTVFQTTTDIPLTGVRTADASSDGKYVYCVEAATVKRLDISEPTVTVQTVIGLTTETREFDGCNGAARIGGLADRVKLSNDNRYLAFAGSSLRVLDLSTNCVKTLTSMSSHKILKGLAWGMDNSFILMAIETTKNLIKKVSYPSGTVEYYAGGYSYSDVNGNIQTYNLVGFSQMNGISQPVCRPGYGFSGQSCSQCSANTYSTLGGICTACPSGYESQAGSVSCKRACPSCPGGKYKVAECTDTTDTVCSPCSAGTYALAGSTACTPCAAGLTSNAGSSTCGPCAPGTYLLPGSSVSRPCPTNSWSTAGATTCTANMGYYDLGSSLTAYYPFNPDQFVADVSGKLGSLSIPNVAPLSDCTTPSSGPGGNWASNCASAMQGDIYGLVRNNQAQAQYFQIPSFTPASTALSICLWYQHTPGQMSSHPSLYGFFGGDATNDAIILWEKSGYGLTVQEGIIGNAWTSLYDPTWDIQFYGTQNYGPGYMNPNVWYHTCLTISDYKYSVYINGASVYSGTKTNLLDTVNPRTANNMFQMPNAKAYGFQGKIDEFRMYNRALTNAEVAAIYTFQGDSYTTVFPMLIQASPGQSVVNGVLTNCPVNYFCPGGTTPAQTCMVCPAGSYKTADCTATADTICVPCPTGSFCTGGASNQACTVCSPGAYTSTACTAAFDAACTQCEAGKFTATADASACTACAVDTYALAGSTGCVSSVAPSGQYFSTATATFVACPANSFCPGGSVQPQACTTTCAAGKYLAAACTVTSDTVCPGMSAPSFPTRVHASTPPPHACRVHNVGPPQRRAKTAGAHSHAQKPMAEGRWCGGRAVIPAVRGFLIIHWPKVEHSIYKCPDLPRSNETIISEV
jgi:hypothetical protein